LLVIITTGHRTLALRFRRRSSDVPMVHQRGLRCPVVAPASGRQAARGEDGLG
jgi:hypothetical protein